MNGQSETLVFQTEYPLEHAFYVRGTLDQWREKLAKLCIGNSRLAFAVAAAFAAPLLYLSGDESGGFHFFHASSIGKTTVQRVAGSTWGGEDTPLGYLVSWRTTSNALESTAALHCDAPLCLDEISQVSTREAGEVAYLLASGTGKRRARRDGSGKPPLIWRTLFLSSGEIPLADKIAEDGRRHASGGQQVRVVDVPADAGRNLGVFEVLHGHPNGQAFADYLRDASRKFYGTASRAFIAEVQPKFDAVADATKKARDEFVAENCPIDADGQVRRVLARFGLVAAAGELATAMGILPWGEGEAERAAETCFKAWLEHRGGTGPAEIAAGIEQVRKFFQLHGASRFIAWECEDQSHPVINRAGVKRRVGEAFEFFVFPEIYTREVCAGFNPRGLTKELVKLQLIIPGKDRKNSGLEYIPAFGKTLRFYHFSSAILGEEA
jgi:uncharacterized protein (DUF927 family)